MSWHERVVKALKANDVRLVTYVPDNVLAPLIRAVHDDPWFTTLCPAREEEAVGIVAGAWMAGLRGITLMQTSGFATLPNALASLVCITLRPVLQTLGIEHFAIERLDDVEFVVDSMIRQAYATQAPAAIILSPLLTKKPS
jgi:sulfopyruvate decarboxylase TPP-binding subunit